MKPTSHLNNLTLEMVRRENKAPKLRAKGAETRGTVPFAVVLALELADRSPGDAHFKTVAACASKLLEFYILLDADSWDAGAGRSACRQFCILYESLAKEAVRSGQPMLWRQKPKLHMFQELAEYQAFELGHPARFWTYRDESFVGEVSKMATSRGGPRAAATAARLTLTRFMALSA